MQWHDRANATSVLYMFLIVIIIIIIVIIIAHSFFLFNTSFSAFLHLCSAVQIIHC